MQEVQGCKPHAVLGSLYCFPAMLELRVCSFGFLSVASKAAADADEATPATILPLAAPAARRSLLLAAAAAAAAVVAREECVVVAVVVDVDVVDDAVVVDELLELLLLLLLLLLELLLPLLLALLLLLLAELPPSPVELEFVDESSVGGNFGFGLPYVVVVAFVVVIVADMPTPVLANECRLLDFDLPCGLRGGIGVHGRLLLAAASSSCAARTASISDSGAL